MVPQITSWDQLPHVAEVYNSETGNLCYTSFYVFEDDAVYHGKLQIPQADLTIEKAVAALELVPDDEIFPPWPTENATIKRAPKMPSTQIYIKQPSLRFYNCYKEHEYLQCIADEFINEAKVMQMLCNNPHPNIVRFHGCQVRRGYLIGLVLSRHQYNLRDYLELEIGTIPQKLFMKALEAAINHLHSLGWAHNDINPRNIMINKARMPVLIDFGSCAQIGAPLSSSKGTRGWIEGGGEGYEVSKKSHDFYGLDKIREWLEDPTFTAD